MSYATMPAASLRCEGCDHRAAYHQTTAPVGERQCLQDACECTDFAWPTSGPRKLDLPA